MLNIITKQQLYRNFNDFKNPETEIERLVKGKKLHKINDKYYSYDHFRQEDVADIILGPSYISFERALQFYGMIPEHVPTCTSAVMGEKKDCQIFSDGYGRNYMYINIPSSAFPYGIMSCQLL